MSYTDYSEFHISLVSDRTFMWWQYTAICGFWYHSHIHLEIWEQLFEVEIHFGCIKDPGNIWSVHLKQWSYTEQTLWIHTNFSSGMALQSVPSQSVNSVLTLRIFWSRTVFPWFSYRYLVPIDINLMLQHILVNKRFSTFVAAVVGKAHCVFTIACVCNYMLVTLKLPPQTKSSVLSILNCVIGPIRHYLQQ